MSAPVGWRVPVELMNELPEEIFTMAAVGAYERAKGRAKALGIDGEKSEREGIMVMISKAELEAVYFALRMGGPRVGIDPALEPLLAELEMAMEAWAQVGRPR